MNALVYRIHIQNVNKTKQGVRLQQPRCEDVHSAMLSLLRFNGWALGNSKKKLVHLKKNSYISKCCHPYKPTRSWYRQWQWWGRWQSLKRKRNFEKSKKKKFLILFLQKKIL
jgi:hypothetical protein